MKNNILPKHILLLEILKNQGIGIDFNISTFMVDNFKKPNIEDPLLWEKEWLHAQRFILDLQDRQLIKTLAPFPFVVTYPNWLDSADVFAFITSNGIDYLDQYHTIKSVKWSNIKAWIAISIAAVSAVFTGWPIFKKPHDTKQESQLSHVRDTKLYQKKPTTNLKSPNTSDLQKPPK